MTILAVVAAVIIFLILLILLAPVGVRCCYDESFSLWVYFGAFHLKITWEIINKLTRKDKKKTTKEGEKKKKEKKRKRSVTEILELVERILESLKNLINSLRVKHLKAEFAISGEDAASAAINYGRVCSAVSVGYAAFGKVLNERNTDISVDLNFDGVSKAKVDLFIKITFVKLLYVLLKAFLVISPLLSNNNDQGGKIKRKKKTVSKNNKLKTQTRKAAN